MQQVNRSWSSVMAAVALLGGWFGSNPSIAAAEAAAPPEAVSSEWQHRKLTFSYFGFTTLYTCDGLEDRVRQILLHLGARKDAKVRASGCPGPFNSPSHSAWVNVDFHVLAPAEAPGSETVKAHWTPVELTPRRPYFMGDGDCELIQGMKDVITKNFTLRAVEYRTSCFPHQVTLDGFSVKGQALRVFPSVPSAVTG